MADPHLTFTEGQSVTACVSKLDAERGRFALSLRRSACGADTQASLLASLFRWGAAVCAAEPMAQAAVGRGLQAGCALGPREAATLTLTLEQKP